MLTWSEKTLENSIYSIPHYLKNRERKKPSKCMFIYILCLNKEYKLTLVVQEYREGWRYSLFFTELYSSHHDHMS